MHSGEINWLRIDNAKSTLSAIIGGQTRASAAASAVSDNPDSSQD